MVFSLLHGFPMETRAFVLGVSAHLGLFRQGDWNLAARTVCAAYLTIFALLGIFYSRSVDGISSSSLLLSFRLVSRLALAHLAGLASPQQFLDGKRDTFTMMNPALNLVFTPRKK